MKLKYNSVVAAIMSLTLLLTITFVFWFDTPNSSENRISSSEGGTSSKSDNKDQTFDFSIVLDAGHGGIDPGKVGINGSLEKDINLSIVYELKKLLENDSSYNIDVILTRAGDYGLYDESDSNKKMTDLNNRCKLINSSMPLMVISIHQNSYHSENVHGAQVFYFKDSKNGALLANAIQQSLIASLSPWGNGRTEKENSNYYLLLNVSPPAVIVECGFLSNPKEAQLLASFDYQKQIATAIYEGIKSYINNKNRAGTP